MQPSETYTIEQFMKSNKDLISYDSLSLLEKNNNNIIVIYNLINEYLDELQDSAVTIRLSDLEYIKYKFKPKLLSYDIYGSTELFFIILIINNICNVKEFDFRELKMLKIEHLNKLLSIIYNNEYDTIVKNKNNL